MHKSMTTTICAELLFPGDLHYVCGLLLVHRCPLQPSAAQVKIHILRGTAGFGFWNYPFSARGDILMLPEAIWLFYASPPSNMALVPGIPGWGWKAQVVHSMRPGALAATIPLAATTVLGLLTRETRPAARWMQRLTGAYEALLTVEMTNWHTYTLEWLHSEAAFWVPTKLVLLPPQPQ